LFVKINKKAEALKLCNEILSVKDLNDFDLGKLETRLDRVKQLKTDLNR